MTGQPTARAMVSDVGLQIAGRAVNIGLALASTILLARLLGDSGFGRWATVFAIAQAATYVADLGVLQIAVRQVAREPESEGQILGALISLRTALSLPVALMCGLLTILVSSTDEMRTVGLVASATPLLAGPLGIAVAFQVRARNFLPVFATTLNNILWLVIIVLGSRLSLSPGWLAAGYVGSAAFAALFQVWLGRRLVALSFSGATRRWARLIREGLPIGLGTLVALVYGKVDQVLVFELAGPQSAGLYNAAYRLYEQIQFVPFALVYTVFPVLSAASQQDPKRLKQVTRLSSQGLVFTAAPLICLGAGGGGALITLLYGETFADAGKVVLPLTIAFFFRSLNLLATYMLFAIDRQRAYLWIGCVALVVNVGLNLVLIPLVGFVASAWITALTEATVLVAAVRAGRSRQQVLPPIGAASRLLLSAAAMGLLIWLGILIGAPLLLVLTLGSVTYVLLCVVSGAVDLPGLIALYRQTPRKADTRLLSGWSRETEH